VVELGPRARRKYDRADRLSEERLVAYQDLTDTDAAIADGEAKGRSATVLVSRRETFNAAHQLRDPDRSDEDNERLE
jgi:hypothetical protein